MEFGNGLSIDDPAQIATLWFRAIVLGILLRQILEIRAVLRLLQNVFGLLMDFGNFGIRFADGFEENMLDVSAIFVSRRSEEEASPSPTTLRR